ncbi:DNA dC-_dU-editing enzyme APOBEC-3C-like isoform X1 [Tupaia chinensis]|uniref:DNA dC->dU-editing enzyme APOBEC-3C-like isoform X1 n=2 Tax=Tupaia chinensis TaxID=246437 RepID=UPI000FFC4B27|nr:DNA dC->dU-editing enzyme APOBEC-3C-like isoform X1 [Tupaia chinensis]
MSEAIDGSPSGGLPLWLAGSPNLPSPLLLFWLQALEHAERRFLSSPDILQLLDGGRRYRVTWYLSWSPCSQCARAVAGFLAQHGNVSLRIFVARLYNHEDPENRQGLRTLNSTGTPIRVMTNREFALCWERFVRHQGAAFEPWAGLRENADLLLGQLEDILGVSASWPLCPPPSPLWAS